jgi:quinoprotein glucose dehydrogenase
MPMLLPRGAAALAVAALTAAVVGGVLTGCGSGRSAADQAWPAYNGHLDGDHYSSLAQINRATVQRLQLAWRHDNDGPAETQTNPLVIGRTLYSYNAHANVIALDGATGRELWKFDAGVRASGPHRGLAWWTDGKSARLLAGVMNQLYALDPATGKPIDSFGDHGAIDLRQGIAADPASIYLSLTAPGIVFRDLIIVGFRTTEMTGAALGDIRAFDVRTGQLRWTFHTIPQAGEAGAETWPANARQTSGAANTWAGFALDSQRGIVYAPTGSAAPDFYGAERSGDNLYANSLLALDAATGRRLWHFQAVHHDLWDRDFASPPVLLTMQRDGKPVDAVAQPSKQGFLYVLDRVTGKSLFPIEERAVPASAVPGEHSAGTQPFPLAPAPYARQRLTEALLTTRTPAAHAWAVQQFKSFRSDGQFTPLATGRQTVVFPGFDGGAEWGGAAVDPASGVLYLNANDVAWTGSLVENLRGGGLGAALYRSQCASCHGPRRNGSPPAFPSLVNIGKRLKTGDIAAVIRNGKGRMPPFPGIQSFAMFGLVAYLQNNGVDALPPRAAAAAAREMTATMATQGKPQRFQFSGYSKFLDPDGYPAVTPPWGTLNAIDVSTGKYLWKAPLGHYPELAARGQGDTGSENYGGPVVTAGHLVFIGATIYDRHLRAFDSESGALLWQYELPFAGTATPAVYAIDGRQYVVISTSNARNGRAPQGSALLAFALPK